MPTPHQRKRIQAWMLEKSNGKIYAATSIEEFNDNWKLMLIPCEITYFLPVNKKKK